LGEAEELALAGGYEAAAQAIGSVHMAAIVAMVKTMEHHLDASVRPAAQARCKGRSGNDWRVTPVVGHHQHCNAAANVGLKPA
jgi:hypothetical protein